MPSFAMSVNGPVLAEDLGVTLPHEHLLIDMAARYQAFDNDDIGESPDPSQRWRLVRNPAGYRANLRTTDFAETLAELAHFKAAGGQTVVDLSPHGLATDTERLPELARASGLNVIASTGTYVEEAMPQWAREASVEELTEHFVEDLSTGGTEGVRRGAIGEIGIESASDAEVRSVRASARAQATTGAPCFWHVMSGILPHTRADVTKLTNVYEREGGDPAHLVLCHQDASGDEPSYQTSMMQRGVWLSFDNFGFESVFAYEDGFLQNPTDTVRINEVARLVGEGWGNQLLLSQDICYRMMRRTWGGWGMAHILDTLAPRFAAAGVDGQTLSSLMRDNPGRLLAYMSGP